MEMANDSITFSSYCPPFHLLLRFTRVLVEGIIKIALNGGRFGREGVKLGKHKMTFGLTS
ncbi:hypothetical protein Hanom_Chr01g00017881 [Helianthus anomalus]